MRQLKFLHMEEGEREPHDNEGGEPCSSKLHIKVRVESLQMIEPMLLVLDGDGPAHRAFQKMVEVAAAVVARTLQDGCTPFSGTELRDK